MKNLLKNMFKKEVIVNVADESVTTLDDVTAEVASNLESEPVEAAVPWQEVLDSGYLLTSPEIVGWLSTQEQELLFSALLLFYTNDQSVLDVGCGRADLYGYLQNMFNAQITYKGIDYNTNLINIAKTKYPEANVSVADVMNFSEGQYSWVLGSGLFNLNDHPNMIEYAETVIDKMYELATVGVAFNLLTGFPEDMSDEDRNQLIQHDPAHWLTYLVNRYQKVLARADYMSGDVTFIIFK